MIPITSPPSLPPTSPPLFYVQTVLDAAHTTSSDLDSDLDMEKPLSDMEGKSDYLLRKRFETAFRNDPYQVLRAARQLDPTLSSRCSIFLKEETSKAVSKVYTVFYQGVNPLLISAVVSCIFLYFVSSASAHAASFFTIKIIQAYVIYIMLPLKSFFPLLFKIFHFLGSLHSSIIPFVVLPIFLRIFSFEEEGMLRRRWPFFEPQIGWFEKWIISFSNLGILFLFATETLSIVIQDTTRAGLAINSTLFLTAKKIKQSFLSVDEKKAYLLFKKSCAENNFVF